MQNQMINILTQTKIFKVYFLSFKSGARLELMTMPNIPSDTNDTIKKQHLGIIHLAFWG
jgi:lactoylglutathione lyase